MTAPPLLVVLGIAIALWLLLLAALVAAGRRTAARELAMLLPNLVTFFRGLLRDPRVPTATKVVVALGIGWFVSPIDLIPEFVPVVGPLDDAIIAAVLLRHLIRRAGPDVVSEHWRGDARTLETILALAGRRVRGDVRG